MVRRIALLALLVLFLAACTPIGPLRVTVIADGETRTVTTDAETVGELLTRLGITLDEDDRVTPPETVLLTDGMTVHVVRVEVRTEVQQQIIPYGRETVRDATVPVGQTRLLRAGTNGVEELTYVITLEDGVEVERRLARRVTVQEPQNEILLIGAREEVTSVPISGTIAYLSAHNAWVMRGTTGSRRRLTATGDLDGRVFDLSPDGTRLLFTRAATETDVLNTLWVMDTVTTGAEPVSLQERNVIWAAWAPDGQWIAFSTGAPREAPPGWEAANDLYLARLVVGRDGTFSLQNRRRVLGPTAGGTYGWAHRGRDVRLVGDHIRLGARPEQGGGKFASGHPPGLCPGRRGGHHRSGGGKNRDRPADPISALPHLRRMGLGADRLLVAGGAFRRYRRPRPFAHRRGAGG